MATLSGNKIKDTYQSLVKFSDNGNITTSAKQLTDGFGNNSPLYLSTTQVGIGVTPESGLNLHVYGDAKIGSNLTVIGNLVVEGSTTTVGTDTLTVKDPLIVLANNNTSTDAVDIGFYGKYTPSGTTLYSGLFREALTGKYRLFKDLEDEPTTTVNTSGTGYAQATLIAALEGNVTGNLIGSVTGGTFSGTLLSNVVATTQADGDNSTKVATTAYVDTAIEGHDTLAEILAGGNTTGGTDIAVSTGDDITFADNSKIIFGDSGDIEMFFNGGTFVIDDTSEVQQGIDIDTNRVRFRGTDLYMEIGNAQHTFWTNGTQRLQINSSGVTVDGDLTVDLNTLFVDASANSVGINLTNPSDYTADELVISVPDGSGMTLVSGATDAAYITFMSSTGAIATNGGYVSYNHDTDTLQNFAQSKVSIAILEAEVAYFTDTAFYVYKSTTIDDNLTVQDDFKAGDLGDPYLLFADVSASTVYVEGTLDVNGNVGIGADSPSKKLHIAGDSATSIITLQRTNTNTTGAYGALQWTASDDHSVAAIDVRGDGDNEGGEITFRTTSAASSNDPYGLTERLRIHSDGNIVLGANGNQYGLVTIRQSGTSNDSGLAVVNSTNTKSARLWTDGTNSYLSSGATGTGVLVLNEGGGNVGIGTDSPYSTLSLELSSATTTTGISTPAGITLQNTNTTDGNYTSIQNRDGNGDQNAEIKFFNVSHTNNQGAIAFTTRSSTGEFAEKMRIDSSGIVRISTTGGNNLKNT